VSTPKKFKQERCDLLETMVEHGGSIFVSVFRRTFSEAEERWAVDRGMIERCSKGKRFRITDKGREALKALRAYRDKP
jgi:hypothetical protein